MEETERVVEGDGDNIEDETGWADTEKDEDEIDNERSRYRRRRGWREKE